MVHATITGAALKDALESKIPETGEGTFPLLGKERSSPGSAARDAVRFDRGRIGLELHVDATADMPVSSIDIPLDFHILAEPVITAEYVAKLQSTDVKVTSRRAASSSSPTRRPACSTRSKKKTVEASSRTSPTICARCSAEAYERVARPIDLPLGDAKRLRRCCKVLGVEAGPTVLADGIEKDLALVIAPSITIPCAAAESRTPLPPLANVATLQPGPFTVSVPIAARYDELAKAMSLAFTDGKLFFSKEYPRASTWRSPRSTPPRTSSSSSCTSAARSTNAASTATLDGDIFMTGHPTVEDNELRVPDLEPTIETSNFLLKLKAAIDRATPSAIRRARRSASTSASASAP